MVCFFHPSYNNHCILSTMKLISNSDKLSRFLETISENDFVENFSRPDTKWAYLSTTNITFYDSKLKNIPIGQSETLPNFLFNNHGMHSLITDKHTGELYQDHLCFFRCLSLFSGFSLNNLETNTQTKFRLYWQNCQINPSTFQGVSLHDPILVEDLFQSNVMVYELADQKTKQYVGLYKIHVKFTLKL